MNHQTLRRAAQMIETGCCGEEAAAMVIELRSYANAWEKAALDMTAWNKKYKTGPRAEPGEQRPPWTRPLFKARDLSEDLSGGRDEDTGDGLEPERDQGQEPD